MDIVHRLRMPTQEFHRLHNDDADAIKQLRNELNDRAMIHDAVVAQLDETRKLLNAAKKDAELATMRAEQEMIAKNDAQQQRDELVAALLEISQIACSLSPEQKIGNEALAKVGKGEQT